jgi:methionyl-tRNA synthetase
MRRNCYVTTPIYYVNDAPHLGHTYTTVAADIYARHRRALGDDTVMLTGTDEHAAKILSAAARAGLDPKAYCDRMADVWVKEWQALDVRFDRFIRTTDPDHEMTVRNVLARLHESGDIYRGHYEGLYCTGCEKFIAPEDLVDGHCPDHQMPPKSYCEENYFFRLSRYQDAIRKTIENGEMSIEPETRRNEILGKLGLGLDDISISRTAQPWGVRLPFDEKHTAYVWIDALINYATGINLLGIPGAGAARPELWDGVVHLMAKDIVWFHAVIWSGMLLALGLRPPRRIVVHGFFTVDGRKMSKTIGNVIRPSALVERFGVDPTRMLTVSMFPFGSDGDFSSQALVERYNRLLPDNLGNLVARTYAMVRKYFPGDFAAKQVSDRMWTGIRRQVHSYREAVERFELHRMVDAVFELSDSANKYIQETTPWILAKNARTDELRIVLSDLLCCIQSVAVLLLPVMPTVAQTIFSRFGSPPNLAQSYRELLMDKPPVVGTFNPGDPDIPFRKIV